MSKHQELSDFFVKIGKPERLRVQKWLQGQKQRVNGGIEFIQTVKEAISKIDYDYYIAIMEPAVRDGKIFFRRGNKVAVGYSCDEWKKLAEGYWIGKSRLATLYELFLWYAVRIVDKKWSLSEVTVDSTEMGNYYNNPRHFPELENTGLRETGGYCDGQGNTYKLVTRGKKYVLCGGAWNMSGKRSRIAQTYESTYPLNTQFKTTGVIVIIP